MFHHGASLTIHATLSTRNSLLRSRFGSAASWRRQLALIVPATALVLTGCQGVRDKISDKLYASDKPDDSGWRRDSSLIAKGPPVLYRVIRKKSDEFLFPIGLLGKGAPRVLHLSKRGWAMFDIQTLYQGRQVTPVVNGQAGPTATMKQGMWENASAPLDTVPASVCSSPIAIGKVALPAGTDIVVTNYKLPTELKTLSEAEMLEAVNGVSTLITPGLGIKSSVLADYTRIIRQIPRVGGEPAVLVQYDDFRTVTDTSAVVARLPRHIVIVLEKGVYAYRPSWIYSTTGKPNDRPILKFLEAMDVDGDGKSEVIYGVDIPGGASFTIVFKQNNDTWKEYWRRSPMRCDG